MEREIDVGVQAFRLPEYDHIPDVGLFLEQVCKYMSDCLRPIPGFHITTSMISNYVKMGLIASPVKKQYDREQIASLLFIAVAKSVLSLEDIRLMLRLQQMTYPARRAYEYFRMELENILAYVFGHKDVPDMVGVDKTQEKAILRNTILAISHKVYLDHYLSALQTNMEKKSGEK